MDSEYDSGPVSPDLIRRAKAAEPRALSSLVEALLPIVHRMLRRQIRVARTGMAAPDLEEVHQSVMLRVVRRLPTFSGTSAGEFIHWLYQIVKHCHIDEIRQSRRRRSLLREYEGTWDADLHFSISTIGPLEHLLTTEVLGIARTAIAFLPPRLREVLTLRLEHDMTFDEIAERLGYPSRLAAKSAYWRCIHGIRRAIGPVGDPRP